jgi:hypothetical protein
METAKMREKATSVLQHAQKRRIAYGLNGADGKSIVKADEVCITIIGLDFRLQPEELFSAIYGIIPPPREWRVPGRNVQFFFATDGAPKFYHRDQYVPYGIRLNLLSINYHGDLSLTSERLMIQNDSKMIQYRYDVRTSADLAFRDLPDLAIEIAVDILTDEHSDALAGIVQPRDKKAATQYRAAFEAAMRRRNPKIPLDQPLHPYAPPEENLALFTELGLAPVKVSSKALEIMHQSGAYLPIKEYARGVLLAAQPANDVNGLDRLRAALKTVVPSVPSDRITVRQYDKLSPTAIWDAENRLFAFALPKPCEEHLDGQCYCWIGPCLQDAARDYDLTEQKIPASRLFRAFLSCMGGDTVIKPPNPIAMNVGAYIRSASLFILKVSSDNPITIPTPAVTVNGAPVSHSAPKETGSTSHVLCELISHQFWYSLSLHRTYSTLFSGITCQTSDTAGLRCNPTFS